MSRPLLFVLLLALAAASGCVADDVRLERGPLGPATYEVELRVEGDPTVMGEAVTAILEVRDRDRGASLELTVAGDDPVIAELERDRSGRLVLDTVQGVSPGSAGETDLASLVGQLDPPLARGSVRLGEAWSATRRIATDTLEAELRSDLRLVRFRRVGGLDAAQLEGEVSGRLRTDGPAGLYEGSLTGDTRIAWALEAGRVVESRTRLTWSIPGTGDVVLETTLRPR